jgi:hypothetical protein
LALSSTGVSNSSFINTPFRQNTLMIDLFQHGGERDL